MELNQLQIVQAEEPCPPIAVQNPNMIYARAMLDDMGGIRSEMSETSLYFYDSLVTAPQNPDLSDLFKRISRVEMHHLEIFGQLAMLLGENPRLWKQSGPSKKYWYPAYNQYSLNKNNLVKNAVLSEQAAIQKYTQQAQIIKDYNIVNILGHIIKDEQVHLAIFYKILGSSITLQP